MKTRNLIGGAWLAAQAGVELVMPLAVPNKRWLLDDAALVQLQSEILGTRVALQQFGLRHN